MITDNAKAQIADFLKTLINNGSGKLGVGGNTTSPLALDLDVEVATVSPIAEKTGENVIQVMLEEIGSNIPSKLIREMGVFDTNGNMLDRVNFEAVGPFSGTERIQIFLTVEVE
jgi:hypothetical protein